MHYFDPNSDILRQLTRIADAASTPYASPWSDWLKTLVLFVAGICTAYLADSIRSRASDKKEQLKLRRIVYYELARCFLNLHMLVGSSPMGKKARFAVLKDMSPFDGEAYIKQNPAVYYSLPGSEILMSMYHSFRPVCKVGPDTSKRFGLVEMKSPLGYFSECYKKTARFGVISSK